MISGGRRFAGISLISKGRRFAGISLISRGRRFERKSIAYSLILMYDSPDKRWIMAEQPKEIKLKINDSELKGLYANQISIMHSRYDFVIDFISMFPPEAIVTSRVITNPQALKRIYQAIGINLKKYEEQFGTIELDDEPPAGFTEKIN
jgi:hypothetical protein